MNIRERAEIFSQYVGMDLKGKITTRGYTAKAVAEGIGRQPAAFNRWLNGKVEIPMTVVCEACEFIDIDPTGVIEDAYARLAVEYGERDGATYEDSQRDTAENVIGVPDVAQFLSSKETATSNVSGSSDDMTQENHALAAYDDDDWQARQEQENE